MISVRRLAREWALKVLYQIDIGKTSPQEALNSALEVLRHEFVQRGTDLEPLVLEALTQPLGSLLHSMRPPMERILALGSSRLVEEALFWQELRLERSFKNKFPGVRLDPPMLNASLPMGTLFPSPSAPQDPLAQQWQALTETERETYRRHIVSMRANLPIILDNSMKRTARAFAKELSENRPLDRTTQTFLEESREAFLATEGERWTKTSALVQKQIGNWLQTASFAYRLGVSTAENSEVLDAAISKHATGWKLDRLASVDRNILRLAAYELQYTPEVAAGVVINEAVEIAKKYSSAESGGFINGVLGAMAKTIAHVPTLETPESELPEELIDLPDIDLEEGE